jgi:hypothetical protein
LASRSITHYFAISAFFDTPLPAAAFTFHADTVFLRHAIFCAADAGRQSRHFSFAVTSFSPFAAFSSVSPALNISSISFSAASFAFFDTISFSDTLARRASRARAMIAPARAARSEPARSRKMPMRRTPPRSAAAAYAIMAGHYADIYFRHFAIFITPCRH